VSSHPPAPDYGEPSLPHELEEVVVDTRPIAVVLLSRSIRPLILVTGAIVFAILIRTGPPAGLGSDAEAALAVFALAVIYWITGALPLMVTSLLVIVLLPLAGVMPSRRAYALFGNEAIFFVLAAFMLAAAVNHRGLGRRIALIVFRHFGTTPKSLVASIYFLTGLMSFVVPEHAVAAMVFPIVLDLARTMELKPGQSRYATAMFLAMAWGTNVGGIATLLGGARAPLALAILTESTHQSISFTMWSAATMPLVMWLMIAGYVVLSYFFPADVASIDRSIGQLSEQASRLGRMRFEEKAVATVLIGTVFAWLIGSRALGYASIAILAVVALFALNLLSWREVEQYVNWGIILMYGGAIAVGSALQNTGAAAFLASSTLGRMKSTVVMIAILALTAELLGEALSHSAVVAALLPVGLGLARHFGIDARSITLAVAIPAGLTFILPVGTPANALAYSSGYLRTRDLLVPGTLMILSAWIGLNLMIHFYWPLLGYNP